MGSFRLYRKYTQSLDSSGFTLIELLVVLAIIGAISTIVLTSQSSFNKTLVLANTAYDIALTLRSAENFGLGSRALGTNANAGYGLHFDSGTTGSFMLFADIWPATDLVCTRPDCKPGDHLYSPTDALVRTYTLGNGIVVSDFCAFSSGGWRCAATGDLSTLDIVFSRPNPDAFINANGSTFTSYSAACLTITSPQKTSRFISVAASGQIIANAPSCP